MADPNPTAQSAPDHAARPTLGAGNSQADGRTEPKPLYGSVGDDHASHPEYLAHHFDTPRQQFEAGKLGMWIFLVTEILLFAGLFCAYAVFRANHPEIFEYGHRFLNTTWGAINTAVLITSSLTMAWAVRAAQLNQRKTLVTCLSLTLLCACGFLGIKYVEYKEKWEHGLLWASKYHPTEHAAAESEDAGHAIADPNETEKPDLAQLEARDHEAPRKVGVFFSIYFVMTGLHAIHVLGGMGAISWVLVRSVRGAFHSHYFGPVDYVGLYWHLVDLVWIYLFPLLYLIH
ncbi:MAG: cytochrome c oxidase subunit 3 family protein [Thermoguttaceae bacterium]|nr:cytochrome c oxidase subunit 3 family protein [Thermoguttaceae bacterium]